MAIFWKGHIHRLTASELEWIEKNMRSDTYDMEVVSKVDGKAAVLRAKGSRTSLKDAAYHVSEFLQAHRPSYLWTCTWAESTKPGGSGSGGYVFVTANEVVMKTCEELLTEAVSEWGKSFKGANPYSGWGLTQLCEKYDWTSMDLGLFVQEYDKSKQSKAFIDFLRAKAMIEDVQREKAKADNL